MILKERKNLRNLANLGPWLKSPFGEIPKFGEKKSSPVKAKLALLSLKRV
jgi:hypothetical protein